MMQNRDSIREQNQLSEEIVQAISSASANDTVDEDELQKELDALQQEKINNDMLKSGNIPATLPNAPNGESELCPRTIITEGITSQSLAC